MRVILFGTQQQNFNLSTRVWAKTSETSPNDFRVVDDQDIARLEVVADLVKTAMFYFPRATMEHHQTGVVAGLNGFLCD
jgi:hypothetical protein